MTSQVETIQWSDTCFHISGQIKLTAQARSVSLYSFCPSGERTYSCVLQFGSLLCRDGKIVDPVQLLVTYYVLVSTKPTLALLYITTCASSFHLGHFASAMLLSSHLTTLDKRTYWLKEHTRGIFAFHYTNCSVGTWAIMASPRTRRVLSDLKPKDDNNVSDSHHLVDCNWIDSIFVI